MTEEYRHNRIYIGLFWTIVLIVVVLLKWFFLPTYHNQTSYQIATTTPSTDIPNPTDQKTSDQSLVITKPQAQKISVPAPSLDRPLPDTSTIDPATVSQIKASIEISIANLKKNQNSFQDWINLGFGRKTLGDYTGAALAWEYVSLLYPQNSLSFGNLGDLYENFLVNLAKAETEYQMAIQNSPQNIDYYRNLYTLYISEKKYTQAHAVLQNGLTKNPNSSDLKMMLDQYNSYYATKQ